MTSITPRDLDARLRAGSAADVIDVRTPVEFREVHCSTARNVPLSDLDPATVLASRRSTGDQPIYVICKSGGRGRQASEKLCEAGVTNVVNVDGGTAAWIEAGLPVVRGKKAISLERQVRIAAGSLAFLGSALGYFMHTALVGLSAFIGAGLVFAGVTDTCGMGLMLARMPWNRVAAPACAVPNATA